MATFLVVKMLDVNYAPLGKAKARASFSNTAAVDLTVTKTAGVHEVQVPPGAKDVVVFVTRSGFFDFRQKLKLDLSTSPPTASFDTRQEVNSRNIDVHTRGSDFNIALFVVMGQLRDAADQVADVAEQHNISFALPMRKIERFATPMLNTSSGTLSQFNITEKDVTPAGKIFVAERPTTPKLISVYHPGFNNPKKGQEKVPLHYHLFYHPPAHPKDPYPFGKGYIEIIAKYLVHDMMTTPLSFGKRLLYQNIADIPKNLLVFPSGSQKEGFGDLNSQSSVLRVLQEVNYWIQRMRGVSFPLQPVGRCALSAFSAGAGEVFSVLGGPKSPAFFDKVLRHVYLIDPEMDAGSMKNVLTPWFRKGAGGRGFRIYTRSANWFSAFTGEVPGGKTTPGNHGAKETQGTGATVLHVPMSFWQSVFPKLTDQKLLGKTAHQLMPALFIEHAVTNSGFAV
jgi:hypothetical protein